MSVRILAFLVMAAFLEVGGDALVRAGLQRRGAALMLAGALTLVVYGFLVNMTRLDFSRLMGIYIVIFFLAAQAIAVLAFGERLRGAVVAGGALILLGGAVMTLWQA